MDPWVEAAAFFLGWVAASALATLLIRHLRKKRHPLALTVVALRNLLLPLAFGALIVTDVLDYPRTATERRVVETMMWIAAIHVGLSFVKHTALTREQAGTYQSRFPKLLIDILRAFLVMVGAAFVIAGVWDQQLGGLLTAIGVSSIVLGLALQNTLDNVMAGIAVLFERPFEVGDWVTVGGLTGQVIEMNWRSVRVRTRDRDLVIVPNSVIGKETLINVSRPTPQHGERRLIGFSYDDPPNKVKRVLLGVALRTRGVLASPAPSVRAFSYAAYSIEYEVRFFISEFDRQPEILDEFMTMVWYAAKRNGLTIPFPIQTSYEYHAELPAKNDPITGHREALGQVPMFFPLSPEELASLSQDAVREEYGRGERIVHQGDRGDTFFLIHDGRAQVSVRDAEGGEREVAVLGRGEFFGEMSVLTGDPRSANVTALDDVTVLVVHKLTFQRLLAQRPALAQEMAEIVEARRQGLRAVRDMERASPEQAAAIRKGTGELISRIRRFLSV